MPRVNESGGSGSAAERKRHPSDSENDPKRSKFNLKLEKVSSGSGNRSKSLSSAGASLKSFLFRKKSSKVKDSSSLETEDSNKPFVNPISLVNNGSSTKKGSSKKSGSFSWKGGGNRSDLLPSTREEDLPQMEETQTDEISYENGNQISGRTPLGGSMKSNLSHSSATHLHLQSSSTNSSHQPHLHNPQNQQRFVSVPKPIPGDRVAYNDPHLHNFHLQGLTPCYSPNKKLIFRPTTYPPPPYDQNVQNNNTNFPHPNFQHIRNGHYQNNLSMRNEPPSNYGGPRGPTLTHIRGPFPPPRLIHQSLTVPRMTSQAQHHHHQFNPRPPPFVVRAPNNENYMNQVGSFKRNNFPSHSPAGGMARPHHPPHNIPSGDRLAHYHNNGRYLHENNGEHALQRRSANTHVNQGDNHPVPKQRKSLLMSSSSVSGGGGGSMRNLNDHEYENISLLGVQWSNLQNEHKLPRVPPVATQRIKVEQMRNISSSCSNLSSSNYNLRVSRNVVGGRSYSRSPESRKSLRVSRSDSDSSIPWFRWFVSRLEKEGEGGRRLNNNNKTLQGAPDDTKTTAAGKNKNCIRCAKLLPTKGLLGGVIKTVVECSVCSLRVCKSCAVWDQTKNSYSCGHCHPPKSVDKRKNFWFDNISPQSGTTFASAEREKTTEEVREHLEQIVESTVYEGIDSVSLSRLFDHPQYDVIFHRFHEELSDALMNLGFSLKLAIENKPMSETPTSAHTNLTEILNQIKETAMELPLMEPITIKTDGQPTTTPTSTQPATSLESQPSYEDVLATAVINKAVINGQKLRRKVDSPMSLVDSAVQTDSEMSESSEVISNRNQYNVRGWVTNLDKSPPQQHPNLSDDDLSMGTSSSNWSNEGNSKMNTQVVIEEQVEEITTTYESDSDMSKHPPVRNRKGRKTARQRNNDLASGPSSIQDDTLLGVEISHFDARVPFPEGGVEIVSRSKVDSSSAAKDDGGNEEDEDPTGILISQISEWEQNWLFKRRKQILRKRNLMAESVSMLVPNPTDDGIEPQIGTDKISDLSDLSDHVNDDNDDDDDDDLDYSSEQSEAEEAPSGPTVTVTKPAETIVEEFHPPQVEANKKMSISSTTSSVDTQTKNVNNSSVKPESHRIVRPVKKVESSKEVIQIEQTPVNSETPVGKTAKFSCIAKESSPDFSVAWFHNGQLLTTREGKTWIYSVGKTHHFLYVYNVNEDDSGKYHISLFDYKGNETKYTFNLAVTGGQRRKPESPTFTVLENTVRVAKSESVISVPFEIIGYPEPYLQVFKNEVEISKLSHTFLEDEGNGKWKLELRRPNTNFKVDGTYVAVAKNPQGVTRVTFMIQEEAGAAKVTNAKPTAVAAKEPESIPQITLVVDSEKPIENLSPSPLSRPASVASEGSSIGETLRETYHTLNRNQTLVKEDYEADLKNQESDTSSIDPSKMTVAERDKIKWANPVKLSNNPYAPENLERRIKQRDAGTFVLPPSSVSGDTGITSSDDERPIVDRSQSLRKFARDYYVPGMTNQTPKIRSADGPNFGSSRSLSVTSTSSREGSNEKEATLAKPVYLKGNMSASSSSLASLNKDASEVPKTSSVKVNGESGAKLQSPSQMSPSLSSSTTPGEAKKDMKGSSQPVSNNKLGFRAEVTGAARSPSPSPRRTASDLALTTKSPKDATDLNKIKLPSVRSLAKQFQAPEETHPVPEFKPQNGHPTRVFNTDVINRNYQQVHSLTARSVSKQFREGLKLAHPNHTDINIKLKSVNGSGDGGQTKNNGVSKGSSDSDGSSESAASSKRNSFASTESLNSTGTNNGPSNGPSPDNINNSCSDNGKPVSSRKSHILARAEFWDKRVKEKILDDDRIIQDFPKMT